MKVALIVLPFPAANEPGMNPSLGICYISSFLKANGQKDVVGLDFSLHKEFDYHNSKDYLELIPKDCGIYGLYCISAQFKWLKEITSYIKLLNPNAIVVAGGPHPTVSPDSCLEAGVDIAVQGEGEQPMLYIVRGGDTIARNSDFYDIPGISFKKLDGSIVRNNCANYQDLNKLPFPDRELFGLENYTRRLEGNPAVHIVTLRGCPYNCHFCDRESVGRSVRYRSVDNVLAEIDFLMETYGVNSFVVYDDIFTLMKDRLYDFCQAFKNRGIHWRCWSRTDLLTEESLSIMKDSGLTSITLGVESGDDTILKNINKGASREENRQALLMCKKLEVPVRCSLMYGNPGETLETINNTIDMIKETQPDEWNLAVLCPVPGSEFWNSPKTHGISFDRKWVAANDYIMLDRFGDSGVGNIWVHLDSMNDQEFTENLKYFIKKLEEVCPRKKIQDTIQQIRT